MFDIGFAELLVIGVVALIVVGPKDLPGMFRTLGRFTGKMRNMAREFQRAMNDAADEAGVKDISRDLKETTSSKSLGLDKLNEAADKFEKWDPKKAAAAREKAAAKRGPETAKMTEERAEKAAKIREAAAERAEARRAAEAAAEVAELEPEPEPEAAPAPKPKPKPKPKAARAKPKVKAQTPGKRQGDSA